MAAPGERGRTWLVAASALVALAGSACGDRVAPADAGRVGARSLSTSGMVVTGSPLASEAGRLMLARGGNAVDAAVAAAFALTVVEPTQSGLGGRTQMLVHREDGRTIALDGTTQVPAGYDPATAPRGERGHGAVGVPGTVAALLRALAEHGSLPLATVLELAIGWARDGFALPEGEAARLAALARELDPASEAARLFTAGDGRPLAPGQRLVQPELAGVLEALAAGGAEPFYRGAIARRIAADMAERGGFVTLADLAAYRAVEGEVGRGRFRGHEVRGGYLPASGVTAVEILQILDRIDPPAEAGRREAALVEALRAGFEDREVAEAWPAQRAVAWLTSDSLAARRAAEVARVLARAHPGERSARSTPAPSEDTWSEAAEAPFTTHVSAADTFGNAIALTQSLGPTGGARVVTPGLGFLYASTLGGYLSGGGPGYRPWSSQAPLLVLRDGRPYLVLGGGGARRILSALATVVDRSVGGASSLAEAMDAPRLHPTGGRVLVEEGRGIAPALEALGFLVERRPAAYFARLNGIEIGPDGAFHGVGEPRWSGSAAAGPDDRARP